MRDLFTVEDLETIATMLTNGDIEHAAAVVDVSDPDHEYWLNEYLNLYRETAVVVDSKVEQEMLELAKKGEEIDTPEKEKFWEARLKLERDGKPLPPLEEAMKASLTEKDEEESSNDKDESDQEVSEEDRFTKKQLQEKLAVLGVPFKEVENKAALLAKLKTAVSEKVPMAPNPEATVADKA